MITFISSNSILSSLNSVTNYINNLSSSKSYGGSSLTVELRPVEPKKWVRFPPIALKKMEIQQAKGTKDYSPEEQLLRDNILAVITKYLKLYGFSPLDTPILERYETLSSKFAGGEEIIKEIFKLKDQGNRELALRYDLTVPLARYITLNPNIKLPFKRYQIGNVFRDGPVSSNRIREFLQVDADILGSNSLKTDAELLALTSSIFKELKIPITIRINNKKLLDAILDKFDIKDKESCILTLDKLDKIGEIGVKKELKQKGFPEKILDIIKQNNPKKLNLEDTQGYKELEELLNYCKKFNIRNIKPDLSLARGLNYYTSTVIEISSPKIKEMIAAGGRYDNLIKNFSNRDIPAVGISFGIDRISTLLKKDKLTLTQIYIIPIGTTDKCIKIAQYLRELDINTDIDLQGKGISKNLDYANKLQVPYVLLIGDDELKLKRVKLRDMKTGKEKLIKLASIKKYLR